MMSQTIFTNLEIDNSWAAYNMLQDREVEKNYRTTQMAQDLKVMSEFYQKNQPFAAKGHLSLAIDSIKKEYPNPTDVDFLRMLYIMENYMGRLDNLLAEK